MKALPLPLQLTGSLRIKSRISQWGLLLLLGGLGVIVLLQARLLMRWSGPGEATASPTIQAMQARLSGVSLGITSYLQNHDPESLARITMEGKEASRLLADLKGEAQQSENQGFYERVAKASEEVRQAALTLLAADHQVITQRKALKDSEDSLRSILSDQIETSIRSSQLNSTARLRAVRTTIDEANTLFQNPGSESVVSSSRVRFKKALMTYEELSRTRRSGRWADDARALFEETATHGRDVQAAEAKRQSATDAFRRVRNSFDGVIRDNLLRSSGSRLQMLRHPFSAGLGYAFLAGLLLLAGIAFVLATQHQAESQLISPLHDILQCVEAAAAGDVTRSPQHWSRDEVGQLAQAVARLISVLARSENLVYHLAALVESSGEAIISHTLDGTILSWNKGAQRIYGYSAEEVKGQSIAMLSPNDGGAEMLQYIARIRKGERLQPFETLHQARNGRSVKAFVRMSAILDSTRKVIGASFLAQDLTETNVRKSKTIEESTVA